MYEPYEDWEYEDFQHDEETKLSAYAINYQGKELHWTPMPSRARMFLEHIQPIFDGIWTFAQIMSKIIIALVIGGVVLFAGWALFFLINDSAFIISISITTLIYFLTIFAKTLDPFDGWGG